MLNLRKGLKFRLCLVFLVSCSVLTKCVKDWMNCHRKAISSHEWELDILSKTSFQTHHTSKNFMAPIVWLGKRIHLAVRWEFLKRWNIYFISLIFNYFNGSMQHSIKTVSFGKYILVTKRAYSWSWENGCDNKNKALPWNFSFRWD